MLAVRRAKVATATSISPDGAAGDARQIAGTRHKTSHRAVISASEKGMQWEEARGLLQGMLHKSFAPNTVSHSAADSACEKNM